jgi:hypothetical protein
MQYSHIGNIVSFVPFGNGHINQTNMVECADGCRYVLQRINTAIFTDPEGLMKNIVAVTEHIRKGTAKQGKDISRCTLRIIRTDAGTTYCQDENGDCWRMYDYVEGTVAKERIERADMFRDCGEAFGYFQHQLADFPAHKLCEVIPNFHNTPMRYENFLRALERDAAGRAKDVAKEIAFVRERAEFMKTLELAHADGRLPLRVTHNDTKLNNILFDSSTDAPVCVIDLDTVMPGYSVNDFGDAIRFGANTAAEDETDLSKVSLDLELYHCFAEGFLRGFGDAMTACEVELMPIGARMMTLECGMRFLTDYLDGDVYFRIHRPDHNLERARCQFALVADMERKEEQMRLKK